MLRSLYELGFGWEAIEYLGFIIDAVSDGDRDGPFGLQIMYGIGGERELTERTLDHLSGWRGARPVRMGNGAWNQRQHDVWGMILDAVDVQFRRNASQIEMPLWQGLAGFVQAALGSSGRPDPWTAVRSRTRSAGMSTNRMARPSGEGAGTGHVPAGDEGVDQRPRKLRAFPVAVDHREHFTVHEVAGAPQVARFIAGQLVRDAEVAGADRTADAAIHASPPCQWSKT